MLRAVIDLAAPQHGVVHRRQLRSLGISAKVIRRLVRDGVLDPVGPSVLRVGGAQATWHQRLWIARLEAPPGSLVSHRSAARLHGIGRFPEGPIDITELDDPETVRRTAEVRRSNRMPAAHRTEVGGLPITTVARTVFDLAGVASDVRRRRGLLWVSPIKVERTLDDALASGTSHRELRQVFDDLAGRGRGGTSLMRALLDERGPGFVATESELEDLVVRTFRSHGVEPPARQQEVGGTRAPVGRVDFLDARARAVLEADGRKHHSELLDRERDAWRDLELASAGFVVVRVTHRQLSRDPGRFIRRWIELVEHRRAQLAA